MADALFSDPNLSLGLNMYHLLGTASFTRYLYQQQHELRESFTQYQLFTTQMYIKS